MEVTITTTNLPVVLNNEIGSVVETLPDGFAYVTSSISDFVTQVGQDVTFTIFGSPTFTYEVTASDTAGTHDFDGTLVAKDANEVDTDYPVGGDDTVTVEAATTTPETVTPEPVTPEPEETPDVVSSGEISRIEPGVKGVTLSAGDPVILGVLIYGLQDVNDQKLAAGVTFEWTQDEGIAGKRRTSREMVLRLTTQLRPSPGKYQITASLDNDECVGIDDCSATVTVQVRRPSASPDPAADPVNPPGEIPAILTDGDGNQYEVFTPEGGGTFTGEGYSLSAGAGAIPNGEYIGVRVSDEGLASNRHDAPALHARRQHVQRLGGRCQRSQHLVLRAQQRRNGMSAAPGRVENQHLRPVDSGDQRRRLADDPVCLDPPRQRRHQRVR